MEKWGQGFSRGCEESIGVYVEVCVACYSVFYAFMLIEIDQIVDG